jgi:site-specific recombinase
MWYFIDGFVLYFGVIAGVYGFVWCTRNASRWFRRRRNAKNMRQSLKERPIDYKALEREIKSGKFHTYDKQALGRILRNVTGKSGYN